MVLYIYIIRFVNIHLNINLFIQQSYRSLYLMNFFKKIYVIHLK